MINSKELYEMRNKVASKLWKEIPITLRHILTTMNSSGGEYGASDALRYLNEHRVGLHDHSGTSKFEYLKWVDRVFRDMCMYPLFSHEDIWENQGDEVEEILARAERYLRDLAADYDCLSSMARDENGFINCGDDLVTIAQDLDMFFCIMYWYKEDDKQFNQKLEDIFEATKRNVSCLLQNDNAAELKDFHGMEDYLPMHFIYWENIAWLYHYGGAAEFTLPLMEIYEEYVNFLYSLDAGRNWQVRDEIVMRAEEDLQFLYELDADSMIDEVPENEYPYYVEQCGKRVQESKKRVEELRRSRDIRLQAAESESENDEDVDWEKKWEDACRVLRDEIGQISYDTWIDPLSIHHVDSRNGILYLKGPKQEELIDHINEHYMRQIEVAITMFAPELEKIVILPYDPEMQNKHYHKAWGGDFTNELRSFLLAYPTLPVVVFGESEYGDSEQYIADVTRTEVVEGCAHDPKTGEFTEKIIAVYVNRPKKIEDGLFIPDEDEIPF